MRVHVIHTPVMAGSGNITVAFMRVFREYEHVGHVDLDDVLVWLGVGRDDRSSCACLPGSTR